jgi:glycosyltransferase involved in cell wall biosynthesis
MTHRPLRICHVISSLDARAGGPAVALAGLASAQQSAGMQISIIATPREGESDDAAKNLRAQQIQVELLGPASGRLRRHPQIVPTLEKLIPQVDLLHIHALWEEIQHQASRLARKFNKPYIIRPCGMLDPWSLSQNLLVKKLYLMVRMRRDLNCAAALHFTTGAERDLTEPLRLKAPAIVEPNGLDVREFDPLPPAENFRQRIPQFRDRRIVLFLSRVHPKKGLDLLIPAFARAKRENAVLVIAGPDDDGYGTTVRDMVTREGLINDVAFTGMLRGAVRVEAMAAADLFVLPSYQENFGIAVVEALACGCPVIISDQVNIHAEVSQANVGAVVPMDVAQLSEQITRWLADDSLRADAAKRGREFALKRFAWEQIAQRWGYHYSRLCATGGEG